MFDKGNSTYFWVGVFIVFGACPVIGQYSGGDGSESAPFKIGTVADWQALIAAPADWDMHFQLMNDIDFGGIALTPVAPDTSTSFIGVFDGNGHVLRNATIDMSGQDYVGLFGRVGQIRDLGVEGVDITGRYSAGGLGVSGRGGDGGFCLFCRLLA